MTEVERYKKLKGEVGDLSTKIVDLRAKINAPKTDYAKEYDELVRAGFLGDPTAAAKLAAINASGTPPAELRKAKMELDGLEHRREILHSAMVEVSKKAEPELGAVHTKHFARAVKALAAALRAAHKAELELAAVRGEADRAFIEEIDSRLVPLPTWAPLLLRGLDMRPELVNFLEQMKGQGFDVS